MKKIMILAVATLALAAASVQKAEAGVVVGATVGIPVGPGYISGSYSSYGAYGYPGQQYYGPAYCPPPVVYAPPVVTYRPPVYVGPPVVSFGFNFGGGHYGHHHYGHHRYGHGHHNYGHHYRNHHGHHGHRGRW